MSDFRSIILKAIGAYKDLIKKTVKRPERTTKIRQLGIKRSNIKTADDLQLYQMGQNILETLKKDTNIESVNHRGTKDFLCHLETLLSGYKVQNEQVINTNQKVACALVSAIQLLSSNKTIKNTPNIIKQLKRYSKIVKTSGTEIQKKALYDAMHDYRELIVD